MSDPLAMKPYVLLCNDRNGPFFLSDNGGRRSVFLEDGGLEPRFTWDLEAAREHVAWRKKTDPSMKIEILERAALDPAELSRRYDAAHPPRRSRNNDPRFGARLASKNGAAAVFDRRKTAAVERKQKLNAKLRPQVDAPRYAGRPNRDELRRVLEAIADSTIAGNRSAYVSSFKIPGMSAKSLHHCISHLIDMKCLVVLPGPSGSNDALARYDLTAKGGAFLYG